MKVVERTGSFTGVPGKTGRVAPVAQATATDSDPPTAAVNTALLHDLASAVAAAVVPASHEVGGASGEPMKATTASATSASTSIDLGSDDGGDPTSGTGSLAVEAPRCKSRSCAAL